jgi:hypothetical protein
LLHRVGLDRSLLWRTMALGRALPTPRRELLGAAGQAPSHLTWRNMPTLRPALFSRMMLLHSYDATQQASGAPPTLLREGRPSNSRRSYDHTGNSEMLLQALAWAGSMASKVARYREKQLTLICSRPARIRAWSRLSWSTGCTRVSQFSASQHLHTVGKFARAGVCCSPGKSPPTSGWCPKPNEMGLGQWLCRIC